MASDIENLRRIKNLEALVQTLGSQLNSISVSMTKMQATVNSLVTTVNGMTKP